MQKDPLLQFEGFNSQLWLPSTAELLYTIPGISTVAELHPPGQAVPLGQSPEQALVFKPCAEPNLLAGQSMHEGWATRFWNLPAGHGIHATGGG